MLGKLIKHEFKATVKIFGLLFGALLILTVLTRFCVYIPFDNTVFDILNGLLTVFYVIGVAGLTMFAVVVVVMRFNRSMLRDEGYLTHTLPVKTWQHLMAKGITYTVWIIASVVMMFVSLFLFFVGTDKFSRFLHPFNKFIHNVDKGLLILLIVVMIFQVIANLYNFFAALSLGQIFTKHKIAGAVLFYFVLNYAMSFLTTGMMMLVPNFVGDVNKMDEKINAAKNLTEIMDAVGNAMYLLLIFGLVANIILTIVYFAVSNYMLSKKLNLE